MSGINKYLITSQVIYLGLSELSSLLAVVEDMGDLVK